MAQFGDPASLRKLATALQGTTTLLSTTTSGLGGQVGTVVPGKWTGGAATAFQAHWSTENTQMLDLGLASGTIATVLNDLATALDAANLAAARTSALGRNPAAAQQATQLAAAMAQQAWTQAMNRLAGVQVPVIQAAGITPNLQQSMAWANAVAAVPPTTAPPFGQGYQMQWDLGAVSDLTPGLQTPEQVMAWFQQHPGQVFPFTLGPDGTTIVPGEQLDLKTPTPANTSSVVVTTVTPTSFTFSTLPGHFDPPGSTITFTVLERDGHMFLEQTAHWNFTDPVSQAPLSLLSVPFAGATWRNQAQNLDNVVSTVPGQFDANNGAPTQGT